MLTRLTGLALSVVAFLCLAGYTALSAYLSIFGLDYAIATFGRYGFIHVGTLVLAANIVPISIASGVFIALAYFSLLQQAYAEPYHTIQLGRKGEPFRFPDYLRNVLSDENARVMARTFLSIAQFAVLVGILVLGAVAGERFGAHMADVASGGGAVVENPLAQVSQRVVLHFKSGIHPTRELAYQNGHDLLNLIWEDEASVTVAPSTSRATIEEPKTLVKSFFKSDLTEIDRFRSYRVPATTQPSSSSTFWIAYVAGLFAFLLLIFFADYLWRRYSVAELAPLERDEIAIEMPDVVAERAAGALARGKDLRIVRFDEAGKTVTLIRRSAYPNGFTFHTTYVSKTPAAALSAWFLTVFRRPSLEP